MSLHPGDHLLRRTSSAVFDPPVLANAATSETGLASPSPTPVELVEDDAGADADDFASSIVISGGTGGNAICHAFKQAAFVLPISDDGGSSSEILRCLGGPSIGDIRSRLIRLAPTPSDSTEDESLAAIIRLLSYRIPSDLSEREAKDLWREVVEGTSELWAGISADRREVLHRFFVIFESDILQRAHKSFSFINASLGNILLASAQRFFLSLPAAIFLFASITQIAGRSAVLPAILTNQTATIAAELESGETIVGQCNISHPAQQQRPDEPDPPLAAPSDSHTVSRSSTPSFGGEDGIDSGRGKSRLRGFNRPAGGTGSPGPKNLIFRRTGSGLEDDEAPLESRIRRLFYINSYGQEIFPIPNPEVIQALSQKDVLVYSCGSLYTSLCPCLALNGMASAIRNSRSLQAKVLLLNTTNDRETPGYTALDYIQTIVQTLNRYDTHSTAPTRKGSISTAFSMSSLSDVQQPLYAPVRIPHSALVSHLVCIEGSAVEVDDRAIQALGIKVIRIPRPASGKLRFDTQSVALAMERVRRTLF